MIDGSSIGGIKINSVSGNASIHFGDATISSSSVTVKAQGNAFSIGDLSKVWSPMSNGWMDNDGNDQDSGGSPTTSAPLQV
ncbi:spore germination protein [Ferdinandcohnia sp. Marseille-Q9671]